MKYTVPSDYDPHMTVRETQEAIKFIRDLFQKEFGKEMGLSRISAPLFVSQASGLNDNLNGVERPVSFDMKAIPGETFEVVQSLAKWKRHALGLYGFNPGEGLYTNMNAIRRDEELDNLHSCYVDQWDWEMVINREDRNEAFLREVVQSIFRLIKHTEHEVWYRYPEAVYRLPEEIYFTTTEDLEKRWPDKTRKERENLITKEHGAVFIEKIGWPLADGERELRVPRGLSLPQGRPHRHPAPHHRRRYRTVQTLHAPPRTRARRRSAGLHLARRYARGMCFQRNYASVKSSKEGSNPYSSVIYHVADLC